MILEREIFINAFPKSLTAEVNSLLDKLNLTTEHKSSMFYLVSFDEEILKIPQRIYFNEPNQQNLSETENFLLDCFFTRHHNGYVREKRLRQIIKSDSYLATPFITLLLGEYVAEILVVIKDNLSITHLDNLIKFKVSNPKLFIITEQRMQSYWDCYFKWNAGKKVDFVGFHILKEIRNRSKELKPKDIQ